MANAGASRPSCKSDDAWTYYDDPLLADLLELRDVLWRKYQRKHLSWEDIAAIEKLIIDRGGEVPVRLRQRRLTGHDLAYDTAAVIAADKAHAWHPFTAMREWCAPDTSRWCSSPAKVRCCATAQGANTSTATPRSGRISTGIGIRRSTPRSARNSTASRTLLSSASPIRCAAQLAQELVALWPAGTLTRVFFSDDGSTAIEVALKMAAQFWQLSGQPQRRRFVAFSGAYHGDTMGASSLGGIAAFHERFAAWQFPVRARRDAGGLAARWTRGNRRRA